jgi:hypothetical protein
VTLPNPERQESGFVAYLWRICGAGGPGTFDRYLRIVVFNRVYTYISFFAPFKVS